MGFSIMPIGGHSRHVTSATMQVLFEAPGEEFSSGVKQTWNKNHSIEELAPYTIEFSRVVLK
jgi:hypothetical protein